VTAPNPTPRRSPFCAGSQATRHPPHGLWVVKSGPMGWRGDPTPPLATIPCPPHALTRSGGGPGFNRWLSIQRSSFDFESLSYGYNSQQHNPHNRALLFIPTPRPTGLPIASWPLRKRPIQFLVKHEGCYEVARKLYSWVGGYTPYTQKN